MAAMVVSTPGLEHVGGEVRAGGLWAGAVGTAGGWGCGPTVSPGHRDEEEVDRDEEEEQGVLDVMLASWNSF